MEKLTYEDLIEESPVAQTTQTKAAMIRITTETLYSCGVLKRSTKTVRFFGLPILRITMNRETLIVS